MSKQSERSKNMHDIELEFKNCTENRNTISFTLMIHAPVYRKY